MTKFFDWLGSRLPGLPLETPVAGPAEMTDSQLREAIFGVSVRLIDYAIGPWLQQGFDGGAVNDPRFRHPMPTTAGMHVLMMFAAAHDSASLAAIALHPDGDLRRLPYGAACGKRICARARTHRRRDIREPPLAA